MDKKKAHRNRLGELQGFRLPGWIPFVVLTVLCFCWHGLLLTNDGTLWDSWYVNYWLRDRNWRAVTEFFGSVGMPVYGWLYIPFAWAPDIVGAFMVATFACLLAQAFLTYRLAVELGGLNEWEALCVAVLAEALPFFSAAQDFIMFFFIFMHTLFLCAACLGSAAVGGSASRSRWLRYASLFLFFTSFYNAALLVFYGGFFLLLFSRWRRSESGSALFLIRKFCVSHWDFLLLPPFAWAFRGICTPQFGWYVDYNNPVSNLPLVPGAFKSFISTVFPFHFSQLGKWIAGHPAAFLLICAGMFGGALLWPRTLFFSRSKIRSLPWMGFSTTLLGLAIFPFAAAGKNFSEIPVGDQSRYTILTAVPFVLLVFAPLRAALLRLHPARGSGVLVCACAGLAIVWGCQIPGVYIGERAEWVIHRSILKNAVQSDAIRRSSVVLLPGSKMTSQTVYGIFAFASVFGDMTRLVTPMGPQNGQFFTPPEILMQLQRTTMLPNNFRDINPAGQQMLVVAERTQAGTPDWDLVRRYVWLRWFGEPAALDEYLLSLTSLKTRILKTATPLSGGGGGTASGDAGGRGTRFVNSAGMEMIQTGPDIWVSKYETTQEQYLRIMGGNPSLFADPSRPVERVSWNDAGEFCRRLTESERGSVHLPDGFVYRLPTETEFQTFNRSNPATEAVLAGTSVFWQTQPVGSRGTNALGLCDTTGNVWEWTLDWGDKFHLMRISAGGGFANTLPELSPHPRRDDPLDFYTRTAIRRLFGPTRSDYPDQVSWDRGFRAVVARPAQR